MENFKKLNVISKDEFDTLTPKVPVEPNQDVPPPPMPGVFLLPVLLFKSNFVVSNVLRFGSEQM